ncbi:T9SS type A sorting domain-containing protein [Labilibacter sediminis]|nr:T9SS type A sorting domain-containing protein [Labilibacter sediminis]
MKNRILPVAILKQVFRLLIVSVLFASSAVTLNAQNLLKNGGFESYSFLAGSNTNVNFDHWTFDVPDDSRNGKQNLRIKTAFVCQGETTAKVLSNGSKGKLNQVVTEIDSAQTYLLSVYVKPGTITVDEEVVASYDNVDFHLKARAQKDGVSMGLWKKEVYTTSTTSDPYIRYGYPLFFNEDCNEIDVQLTFNQARESDGTTKIVGEFAVDSAMLVPVTEFINLDFEEGIDYVWRKTLTGTATCSNETVEMNAGEVAARLSLAANEDTAILKNQIRIPVTFGMDYTISAMAKTLIDNGDADSLKIVSKTYNGDHDLVVSQGTRYDINSTFTSYSHIATPTADTKYMAFEIEVWNQAGNYIIDDVTVVESISTDVKNIASDNDLRIYPNPATDAININYTKGNKASLKIFDTTGKVVVSKVNVQPNDQVELSGLSNGVYIVELVTEIQTSISKVIKK